MTATVTSEQRQRAAKAARQISACAAEAARILVTIFDFQVREDCPASMRERLEAAGRLISVTYPLGLMIDQVSNIYHVVNLRPELHWWQRRVMAESEISGQLSAGQLGMFLKKLCNALSLIYFEDEEKAAIPFRPKLPGYLTIPGAPDHVICGAALRSSNAVFQHYGVSWKEARPNSPRPRPEWLAGIIDTTTHMYRAVRLLPVAENCRQQLAKGEMTLQEITTAFKYIGIQLDYLPCYDRRDGEDESKIVLQ